ncbi:bifunctional 3-deoxy-7-phosphoheptulonate synthase/chorismate mutase [Cytobacillus purgationiresistens]|uniref:3-deoxy-7-phosphoheptulonate synthase/chorismate mutase n=1 Tax=Cytobacillus purgationiresistens TaxID=863449 RepID=A0ABU0ALZ1_9BACI|nr:bifunctional 3-deoxy-7-phosphoheptulonate synthase/chorismate mutase [Cytobacillus purgationiresistens]MDQ0272055.1 3-deoxy-7-phosphoheptulonate synthase/chorismate mutase [Cytobacillus purgationiresistens]
MNANELEQLRKRIDRINLDILELLNERAEVAQNIGWKKEELGMKAFDPIRENESLALIIENHRGPFEVSTIKFLFKEIFKASLNLQNNHQKKEMLVSRKMQPQNTIVDINGEMIGDGSQRFIMGPCAVESYDQVKSVALAMKKQGLTLLRGGAFKPRTSPYDFQGLGERGLQILRKVGDEVGMSVISEIVSSNDVEMALPYVDVIQIGARNMQNFELLKTVGKVDKPVLLKRGLSATIEEFINAAEYIMANGNNQIILCERGIRTYEKATRNTLDISAVPILKKETHLPVIVDVTHSTGRKDLLLPTAKAALAIGADAVMAEVHPDPAVALSDSAQQMNIAEFNEFIEELKVLQKKLALV